MPLNNFGGVAPGIYRAATPDPDDLRFLRDVLGVTFIVKLNTDEEEAEPALPGINVLHVALAPAAPAPDDAVTRMIVEQIRATRQAGEVVLIHCTHGRDRTGFVCAAYGLLVLGQSLERVLAERARYGVNDVWHRLFNHSFTEALERLAADRPQ